VIGTMKSRLGSAASHANQRVMGRLVQRGNVPRIGFQHYFIEAEGLHSRIHLQNFYSTFFPHVDARAAGTIDAFGPDGSRLGRQTFELGRFGSLFLEIRDLLSELGSDATEGSVTVDLKPPTAVLQELGDFPLPDPWALRISTPFWMAFYDGDENYMYVHSIDRFAGTFHGVPAPVSWLLRRKFGIEGEEWKSGRLLDAAGITELQIVVLNHSAARRRASVGLFPAASDVPVATESIELEPHALERIRFDMDAVRAQLGDERLVQLGIDPLPTANGKPYVLMRYGKGPLSLHHG
jgi:hypothetical protein